MGKLKWKYIKDEAIWKAKTPFGFYMIEEIRTSNISSSTLRVKGKLEGGILMFWERLNEDRWRGYDELSEYFIWHDRDPEVLNKRIQEVEAEHLRKLAIVASRHKFVRLGSRAEAKNDCPYCPSIDELTIETIGQDYAVRCLLCGNIGPMASTPEDALDFWKHIHIVMDDQKVVSK